MCKRPYHKMSRIQLADCGFQNLNVLFMCLLFCVVSVCIKRMSQVIQESAADSAEPFKSHMMQFVDRG